MMPEIKEIWIGSEVKGPIIGGESEINDNSDVIVTFIDDRKAIATFFTYQNIEYLRKKNRGPGKIWWGGSFGHRI